MIKRIMSIKTHQASASTNTMLCHVFTRSTSASQPAEYLSANLNNGVGRYVCQMQRVTFKFCKEHPNSRGIRDFIENDLVNFARANPGIAVYLQPRRHRLPKISAEYLNGSMQGHDVSQYSREKIKDWLEFMRTRKGDVLMRILKKQQTHAPSIQGVWTPFTNKQPWSSVEAYPSVKFDAASVTKSAPTATQQIIKLANKIKE